jgi:hypothetical protein
MTKVTILSEAQARSGVCFMTGARSWLMWSGNPSWAYVDADGKIRAG